MDRTALPWRVAALRRAAAFANDDRGVVPTDHAEWIAAAAQELLDGAGPEGLAGAHGGALSHEATVLAVDAWLTQRAGEWMFDGGGDALAAEISRDQPLAWTLAAAEALLHGAAVPPPPQARLAALLPARLADVLAGS